MSSFDIGLWSMLVLIGLIFLRMPIGLAMLVCGMGGTALILNDTVVLARLKTETYGTFSNYSLSIVPLFLLMGQFATLGGMSRALFKAADGLLAYLHLRGRVAMAAIVGCAGFGAICGSSLATAATMGQAALPEMRRCGYSGGFSSATLAAGGTLGILIPPSIVLVIYAILTEQNIAKLFLAAFIPGILAAIGYIIAISIYVHLYPEETGDDERVPNDELRNALLNVIPVLVIFLLVVGGIYRGIFTPTEAAAVGAALTGLLAWFAGGLDWAGFSQAIRDTARNSAMIFIIVLGAGFYNAFLAASQVPQELSNWVVSQGFSPWFVLAVILALYLVFGCIMDSLSMILLTVPIFFPIVAGLDIELISLVEFQTGKLQALIASGAEIPAAVLQNAEALLASGQALPGDVMRELGLRGAGSGPHESQNAEYIAIWFGILVLIVVEVGLITPPVGMNLFVINAMSVGTRMIETYRAVLPFIASDIIRTIILVLFPGITLFLMKVL